MEFIILVLTCPMLAVGGAALGVYRARLLERNRRHWAMAGAVLGALLGLLWNVAIVSSELPFIGWDSLWFIAEVWTAHFVIVCLASIGGVHIAYDPYRSEMVYRGPLLACFLMFPVICMPLVLITLL